MTRGLIRIVGMGGVVGLLLSLGGCASDGSLMTTSSVTKPPPAPKVDPACVQLSAKLDSMKKDGIAAKVEKASVRKAKLSRKDLAKVSEYMKASEEFQAKCAAEPVKAAATPTVAAPTVAKPAAVAAKPAIAKAKQ